MSASVVFAAMSRGLRPAEAIPIAEWAESTIHLDELSPKSGRLKFDLTPYSRDILDSMSPDSPARIVTWCAGTQLGKTQAELAIAAYYAVQFPSSVMITLPSKDVAREWSDKRLTRMFEVSPSLQGRLKDSADHHTSAENTLFSKVVPGGGQLKIAWASSSKTLRSTPAKILINDEVDAFVVDTDREGDPLKLIERRMTNFYGAKMISCSSPTHAKSRIWREFERGDQRYYFVPCPHCEHFQVIDFRRLRWESGKPETVRLDCIQCNAAIPERFKPQMLTLGRWLATGDHPVLVDSGFGAGEWPGFAEVVEGMRREQFVSYHMNGLYSPFPGQTWADVAREWEGVQGSPHDLKVFVNGVLAQLWIERGEAPDSEKVYAKRESYPRGIVPAGAFLLTAGVDVQNDRLELEIVAWGPNKQRYSVDYQVLDGDTMEAGVWNQLDAWLNKQFPHAAGRAIPIRAMAIDTGHRPERVYEFARRHTQPVYNPAGSRVMSPCTVICTKGGYSFNRLISNVSTEDAANRRGGIRIYEVGTGFAKLEIFNALKIPLPAADEAFPVGSCHFPSYDLAYFEGLCSESLVTTRNGKRQFVKNGRNEPLDVAILARVAAALCGYDQFQDDHWRGLESQVRIPEAAPEVKQDRTRSLRPIEPSDPFLS